MARSVGGGRGESASQEMPSSAWQIAGNTAHGLRFAPASSASLRRPPLRSGGHTAPATSTSAKSYKCAKKHTMRRSFLCLNAHYAPFYFVCALKARAKKIIFCGRTDRRHFSSQRSQAELGNGQHFSPQRSQAELGNSQDWGGSLRGWWAG